ncbi:zinc-binding dehydrogenase [Actinomyces sp. ZJ308]|uniref:quinone oxidoreductase family protein n=1 Tax=Actinomyces sp. ZJ308 TaxID=2708342 RepID=UPI001423A178|nr:zinc-binding dehydrogenase [Actinomyces sp. ZJ308]
MKAMQIISFNGPSGLRYQDAPVPEPGPGEIAVDVDHAGVGYVEALFAEGLVPIELPWTPGLEVSGHVRALGEGVSDYRIGDAVAALTITAGGGYGQVAVTPAELVTPLPTGLDPVLAAAVPANTTTALIALEEAAHLRGGESVLVHAAAGGLGSQMGQVARILGAGRVVGVTRSEAKRQEILDLGYDEAWLTEDLAEAEPAQFDVVADPVAGPARLRSLELLRTGGRLLVLGDAAQEEDQQVSTTSLWLRGVGVIGFNLGALSSIDAALVGRYLRRAVELVACGDLTVRVTGRIPIQDAARAVTTVRSGATTGKIVLTHETHAD